MNSSLKSEDWQQTCKVIPNGVQTLSKMPSKHVDGVYPHYLERGLGARVYGTDGNDWVDYPCALGAVLLGYNYPPVSEAIKRQVDKGLIFSLPNKLETQLAEKICELIPSAEMCRFLKTGSEATSAAVRMARAYTGRSHVICCGYHGWHDWYNATTPKRKGVVGTSCTQAKYNNLASFQGVFNLHSGNVAAVIIEPYVLEEPKDGFLEKLREMCDKYGALLIFDEVVTGFRTKGFSAQKMFGVTPDLTCLGKAMANGMPISVVCGRREVMVELEGDCFVSSTFGGELASIAAALATIGVLEREPVIDSIWDYGQRLKVEFNRLWIGNAECIGYPPRTFFNFPTEAHKSLFWQECLKQGVLFGYAQFINYSHQAGELNDTLSAMKYAADVVKSNWTDPLKALEGKPAEQTFRLVVKDGTKSTGKAGRRGGKKVAKQSKGRP
jgi:glutamate-1-semialdehyde aminotransferase